MILKLSLQYFKKDNDNVFGSNSIIKNIENDAVFDSFQFFKNFSDTLDNYSLKIEAIKEQQIRIKEIWRKINA